MNIKNKFDKQDKQDKYEYAEENDYEEEIVFVEKRRRVLSDDDIKAIRDEILKSKKCICPINEEDLVEAVKFYKNMNEFFCGTKKKTWDIVLTAIILGILGALAAGIFAKFK
jgi:hypothetical protein